jgi:hypothetical protein
MSIVKLQNARLFFNDLFTAKTFKQSTSYSATFGVQPGSALHNEIEAAIKEVAVVKFGEKKAAARIAAFRPVPQQFPYRDGDTMTWEGAEGLMILKGTKQEKSGKPLVLSNIRYSGDDVPAHKGKFIIIGDEKGTPYGRDEAGKLVELTDCMDEITVPYSGCYVNASVEFWAQDGDNAGIRCSLRAVQFLRDGDAFAGGSKVTADELDDLGEGAEADDLV